jgi:Gluconate 2-dehydrogenase subunit 3
VTRAASGRAASGRAASGRAAGAQPGTPTGSPAARGRFPGFDVTAQSQRWDPVTAGVVLARLGMPPDIRFFTPEEEAIATALCDQLLGQDRPRADEPSRAAEPAEPLVPLVQMIDARLAEQETDGWRYADMPEDGQAWRDTLAYLDADAHDKYGRGFARASSADQHAILQAVQDLAAGEWHGRSAAHVWSLWTRYACTAFYAHPSAWDEIGFPGPAYPRGYKNAGVDKREPFEVADARPAADPARGASDAH